MRSGLILLGSLVLSAVIANNGRANDLSAFDCGSNALFLLLHYKGMNQNIHQVLAALPARNKRGFSMAEISNASAKLGLPLSGELISASQMPPNMPVIAYFRKSENGHFAVLRPVGTTGTMVQLIDPPFAPQIVDYKQLSQSPQWNGKLLVPRDSWKLPVWTWIVVSTVAVVAFVASLAKPRSRSH